MYAVRRAALLAVAASAACLFLRVADDKHKRAARAHTSRHAAQNRAAS
jgi:hypothetical protein